MISKILCCFSKKVLFILPIFIEFAYVLKLFLFREDLHNFNWMHQASQGISSCCYYPLCPKVWSMMRRLIIFFLSWGFYLFMLYFEVMLLYKKARRRSLFSSAMRISFFSFSFVPACKQILMYMKSWAFVSLKEK